MCIMWATPNSFYFFKLKEFLKEKKEKAKNAILNFITRTNNEAVISSGFIKSVDYDYSNSLLLLLLKRASTYPGMLITKLTCLMSHSTSEWPLNYQENELKNAIKITADENWNKCYSIGHNHTKLLIIEYRKVHPIITWVFVFVFHFVLSCFDERQSEKEKEKRMKRSQLILALVHL